MKLIFALAAAAAAFSGASVASANDSPSGHWEWRTQSSIGPRATTPARTRVRVTDVQTRIADCDCAMMKERPADCMNDTSRKRRAPSAG